MELQTSATPNSIRRKKRILALKNQGLKPAQIGLRLGCSRQYVEQILKKYGTGKANGDDRKALPGA